ncbi:hypothetical protein DYB37_012919 [Aphanomyces astaci]|uniref:DDE Tnp4 domain-containing protein n=1 Tax=Aphanomyces astaci TaxID=112090 RepID=A0A418E401_APHAT|nr:hypothetical protein DYB37_012919 [Aphanomyces astaci]
MDAFLPKIPEDCYYLGDAGYALSSSILTPYRSTRYHLREWAEDEDGRPRNNKEVFNYRHSKTRIIVEQAFGRLKRKWGILAKPMELEIPLVNIVIHTCCALHNFVLACGADLGADDDSVDDTAGAADIAYELEELTERFESHDSGEWRDVLANDMWNSYMIFRNEEIN